ncbi:MULTISPECIES: ABC transporter ATP-binding protein [Bradyrhizobium]|uniref:ABC transporter ATP-binding protein n=1 Tax=Bradyrhizobium TaxID=374 RepID=UPI00155F2673|nr:MULTISPECIES: ABC transporter ATP-binding protein [Bradyrhizobium]MDD1520786.1 ABC transporter ATP-binding protein [Bradyrhizobium sp. WBAH30]MDD1545837.1 ABC transporter ATP-binding protein [Bradyrhizobium sp. WBAH41]MDD1558902.1 ABC transporter ATP-binding protein [Bradyrhizobium sp. WBAH23]MDD1566448.1 ABC transporter ATP-binding protein [Bradyrhizobium sp. WBAH33]MDD1592041.1 ABC transporter ATP-binding protein [Bradyrhizobium sp. WBAH42]
METEPILSVHDLQAHFRTERHGVERVVKAVDGISFAVGRGEIYGVAGESSSGKTTLVKTIAGAVRPPLEVVGGRVDFAFLPGYGGLHRAPEAEVARIRWRHLSYIMQGSMNVLNPVRRLWSAFVDFAYPHIGESRRQFEQEVVAHLARLKLDPSVLEAYPHELSGGMRQRATIALATICRPDVILADEPTTALDVVVQKEVLALISAIRREIGSSVLLVSHDLGVHAHVTDRLGIMYAGRLIEEAATVEIFRNPLHPYARHLISSLPRIGDNVPREPLEGTPPNLADPPTGCRFHPRCSLAMEICRHEVPAMREGAPAHRVACFAVNRSDEA